MFELILLAPAVASSISPAATVGIVMGLLTVIIALTEILKKKVFGKPDSEMRKNINLTVTENNKKLSELLHSLSKVNETCDQCYKLHNVKDSDNIPLWYVTSNIKKLIAEVHATVSEMKQIVTDTDENSEEILIKLPELISSNQAITLRLTDLVILLEKLANKISS